MTPELLRLIRIRANQGTEALAVADRIALLAELDRVTTLHREQARRTRNARTWRLTP